MASMNNFTSKTWFVSSDNQVLGPFSSQEIDQWNKKDAHALIWGKGQSEWFPYPEWQKKLKGITEEAQNQINQQKTWKYRYAGREMPYMNAESLIHSIVNLNDIKEVEIWSDQHSDWKDIYAFPQLIEQLGITRRENPRVPFRGEFQTDGFGKGDFKARVTMISQGGMGITQVSGLEYGDQFQGVLTSPHLYAPLHCQCEVVYCGNDPVMGIKFNNLSAESQSSIVEYIKKFENK